MSRMGEVSYGKIDGSGQITGSPPQPPQSDFIIIDSSVPRVYREYDRWAGINRIIPLMVSSYHDLPINIISGLRHVHFPRDG